MRTATPPIDVQPLESRRLLSASITLASGGVLTVQATGGNDDISIDSTKTKIMAEVNGLVRAFKIERVASIVINASGGDDDVDVASVSLRTLIRAGAGDDTVSGGRGRDSILGGDGEDDIDGAAGNDTIDGQAGDDFITAGDNSDLVRGGDDDDTIWGEKGNDSIYGDAGDDNIRGSGDELDDDRNYLSGGAGDDLIDASNLSGKDTLDGGTGRDAGRYDRNIGSGIFSTHTDERHSIEFSTTTSSRHLFEASAYFYWDDHGGRGRD